jgi:GNAT superfamily N-acetyltransferase
MISSTVSIRAATVNDIDTILTLIHLKADFDGCPGSVEATYDQLKADLFGTHPLACIVLAEVDGNPIGFASYHRIYSTFLAKPGLWLDDLYLKPDFRHQGIGTALIHHLCQIAQEIGCGRVDWTVATANEIGIRFYEKMGATLLPSVRLCRLNQAAIAKVESSDQD